MIYRILNCDAERFSPKSIKKLRSIGSLTFGSRNYKEIMEVIHGYDILIIWVDIPCDQKLIEKAARLKYIVCAATGLDHIDKACAKKNNIRIISLQGEKRLLRSVTSTAELTFGLILSLSREIHKAAIRRDQIAWQRDSIHGCELKGKTLGVVGYGRLGQRVARYARAFDMRILAHDPALRGKGPRYSGASICSLSRLLRSADVVSLHASASRGCDVIIGKRELRLMKDTAYLVNTARGALIDEKALLEALQKKEIAGAALDVLDGEFQGIEARWHSLIRYARDHSNLLITPHIGGLAREAVQKTRDFLVDKLIKVIEG